MHTQETVEIRTAVVVTKEALEECERALREVVERSKASATTNLDRFNVVHSATLVDDTTVTFSSFVELLNYSNRSDRRLVEVTFKTQPALSGFVDVDVRFGGKWGLAFSASVSGEEAEALRAKERCKNVAEKVRAAYQWMYEPTLVALYFLIWLAVCVLFGVVMSGGSRVEEASWRDMVFVAPFVLWSGAEARKRLFPRVVFELGQEKERSARRAAIRRWVVTAIFLGVPLAIFSRLIGTRLGF
jgi:hypothetical protein